MIWWPDHWMITNSQIFDCPMEFQEDYFSPNLKRKKKNQQKVVKHNKLYLSIRLTEWSLKISDDVKWVWTFHEIFIELKRCLNDEMVSLKSLKSQLVVENQFLTSLYVSSVYQIFTQFILEQQFQIEQNRPVCSLKSDGEFICTSS